jgi:hypothetical protein
MKTSLLLAGLITAMLTKPSLQHDDPDDHPTYGQYTCPDNMDCPTNWQLTDIQFQIETGIPTGTAYKSCPNYDFDYSNDALDKYFCCPQCCYTYRRYCASYFILCTDFDYEVKAQVGWLRSHLTTNEYVQLLDAGSVGPYNCISQGCGSCPAGQYRSGCQDFHEGSCLGCPGGTYKTSAGTQSCTACTGCPAGQHNTACGGSSAGGCASCVRGTYKISTGSEA